MSTERDSKGETPRATWRDTLYEVIFEHDTPAGKGFDVALIVLILASVAVVLLDSVQSIGTRFRAEISIAEWIFTILFSIEYVLRLLCVRRPAQYVFSFFGIVDLLSVVPTYLSVFLPATRYLSVVRVLRVLRIFRVLKLGHHIREANLLLSALVASRRKIVVFIYAVMTLVVILGSLMYLVEGEENGFTSIPRSIYWTVVTLTTVGFGDITPKTDLGQALSVVVMLLGYGIIAVPTGIVTAELVHSPPAGGVADSTMVCRDCSAEGHDTDARHCKFCGAKL